MTRLSNFEFLLTRPTFLGRGNIQSIKVQICNSFTRNYLHNSAKIQTSFTLAVWGSDSMKQNYGKLTFMTFHCSNKLFYWWRTFFANFQPPVSNCKTFSPSIEQFFLTEGQNNFGNKIPFWQLTKTYNFLWRKMIVLKILLTEPDSAMAGLVQYHQVGLMWRLGRTSKDL